MIRGIGIDVCPIERMEGILERHGKLFVDRVFTAGEQARANEGPAVTAERLAARFAAKEATIKALGAPNGLKWTEMEVLSRDDGAPSLLLSGAAEKRAAKMGVTNSWVSLSHAGGVAVAVVVLEGD